MNPRTQGKSPWGLWLLGLVLLLGTTVWGADQPKAGRMTRFVPSLRKQPPTPFRNHRIARIYVIRRQIFDTSIPSENRLGYRLVNRLHFLTHERTVREQLLFKEGDVYNDDIARETERALRRTLRLRDVRVRPMPVGDNRVDLVVECQDTWSTEPMLAVSGTGEETKYLVGFRERNLFGYGKQASFIYKKDTDVISRTFSYDDPALLGTRLRLSGNYQDTADGSSRFLAVERPFYSSLTLFSFKGQGAYDKTDTVLYADGEEVDRYTQENRILGGSVGFSIKSNTRRVRRLGLGYSYRHDRLTHETSPLLEDNVYHLVGPTFEWQRIDFLTVDRIRTFTREEDISLGPTLKGEVGVSQSRWWTGSANATFYKGQYSQGTLWGPRHFSLATLEGDGRYENGWQDAQTGLDLQYYNRPHPWSTWAAHLAWTQVLNPGTDTQLLLGGDTGLRGYPVNEFAGNRKLLANLENRLFIVDELWKFFGVGAVVFGDAGYAWPRGQAVNLGDLYADYGFGLRFHLTRSSLGQVLRLDVAWPTRTVNGDRSPVVTFGTSQVF